jgi:hypothetical protein
VRDETKLTTECDVVVFVVNSWSKSLTHTSAPSPLPQRRSTTPSAETPPHSHRRLSPPPLPPPPPLRWRRTLCFSCLTHTHTLHCRHSPSLHSRLPLPLPLRRRPLHTRQLPHTRRFGSGNGCAQCMRRAGSCERWSSVNAGPLRPPRPRPLRRRCTRSTRSGCRPSALQAAVGVVLSTERERRAVQAAVGCSSLRRESNRTCNHRPTRNSLAHNPLCLFLFPL